MTTKTEKLAAVRRAWEASFAAELAVTGPGYGCGRCYVDCRKADRPALRAFAKSIGRPFIAGLGLYVGYDNATGREVARARAFAQALTALDFEAWDECHAD